MPERIDVDACVVGAGYAGLTAAYRLSQSGKSVAVLEARDRSARLHDRKLGRGFVAASSGAGAGSWEHQHAVFDRERVAGEPRERWRRVDRPPGRREVG